MPATKKAAVEIAIVAPKMPATKKAALENNILHDRNVASTLVIIIPAAEKTAVQIIVVAPKILNTKITDFNYFLCNMISP